MKNIQRLANNITKHGEQGLMVHTIYGTSNWIISQKIEKNKWLLSLENPMGNTSYNLGIVSGEQYTKLWMELVKDEIEKKSSQLKLAKELKNKINYFIKSNEKIYKNFIKKENTKQTRVKLCKKHKRPKKSNK